MKSISTKQFLREFNIRLKSFDSIAEAASHWNVSPTFVHNVVAGKELPGKKILADMNLRADKTINYRYIPIEEES
jgi:hypothetical protein